MVDVCKCLCLFSASIDYCQVFFNELGQSEAGGKWGEGRSAFPRRTMLFDAHDGGGDDDDDDDDDVAAAAAVVVVVVADLVVILILVAGCVCFSLFQFCSLLQLFLLPPQAVEPHRPQRLRVLQELSIL